MIIKLTFVNEEGPRETEYGIETKIKKKLLFGNSCAQCR
jgi:hypothetical protein